MSELKPCPYCGGEDAYNVYLPDPYSRDQYAWVNCKTCNASGGQFVQRVYPDDKSFSRNEMELESTKLWNTRPIEDELRKHIAALEEELTKMKKYFRKPTHGACCTCQKCGHSYDECRCDLDETVDELENANKRIAMLEATVEVGADIANAYENRISEIVALSNETVGKLNSRIAELEGLAQQLVWVGNDLLTDNTNPVAITLFSGLAFRSKELLP
jgi:Lar family restriction alleviation protein